MREPTGTLSTLTLYVGKKFKLPEQLAPTDRDRRAAKIQPGDGRRRLRRHSATHRSCAACRDSGGTPNYGSHLREPPIRSTQSDHPEADDRPGWYTNAKPGPTTGCNDDPTHPANPAHMSSYPTRLRRDHVQERPLRQQLDERHEPGQCRPPRVRKLRLPVLLLGRNPRRPAGLDDREPRDPADLRHRLHRRQPDFAAQRLRRVPRPREHLRQRHGHVLRSGEHLRVADLGQPLPRQLRRRAPTCSSSSPSTRATQPTPSR